MLAVRRGLKLLSHYSDCSYLILEPELRISFGWFSASCCSLELLLLGLPAGRVH